MKAKNTIIAGVMTVFMLLSLINIVPVSVNVGGVEATVSSITMDLCPTDETFVENTYNANTQTTVKAQVLSGPGNKEGHYVNFTLKHRNATVPFDWTYITHRFVQTDENGTAYWNVNFQNFTYPAVTGTGSQYYSLNISTRGANLPMGNSPSLKYINQSFIMGTADNVTLLIEAPQYITMGSLFRPYIQAFSHELRYDPAGANVSVDIRNYNYAGTNTTVQALNTAFNNNSWVQPTFFLNDTHYNEGWYELFVGLHNNTGAGYPHANYEGAPATGNWYYHRGWYGFRIINEIMADAGTDQTVNIGTNTTLNGTVSTGDLFDYDNTLNYTWTQLTGTTVTMTDEYTSTPYFTAPSIPQLLRFRLNITDDFGRFTWDVVSVRVYDSKITLGAGYNLESNPTGSAVALSVIAGKSTYITACSWRDDATSIWYTYSAQNHNLTIINIMNSGQRRGNERKTER